MSILFLLSQKLFSGTDLLHTEKMFTLSCWGGGGGRLQTEMVLWTMCGDLLAASRWTTALPEARIASSGTSDSFPKVAHLTKTRRAHQITVAALYKLQHVAFN